MRINLAATAIVASLLVISGAPVQAQTADEIALLKQQLAELQQKLAVLEAKQQAGDAGCCQRQAHGGRAGRGSLSRVVLRRCPLPA